jgi:M6 family metalloprotease-like protein
VICTRFAFVLVLLIPSLAFAEPPKVASADADYRAPEEAATTKVRAVAPDRAGLAGYLGVNLTAQAGKLAVAEVQPGSPADKAGLKKGDVVSTLGGYTVTRTDAFRELVQVHSPGEAVKIAIVRDGKPLELTATLVALSKPLKLGAERVTIGVQVVDAKEPEEGTPVERVSPNSPAADAGLKVGDVILKIEGNPVRRAVQLADALAERKAGDVMTLALRREGKEIGAKVKVAADRGERGPGGGRFGGGNFAGPAPSSPWTKPAYRLAVVGVEFEDTKHNAKTPIKEWEEALFGKSLKKTPAGSLNDYFLEQSYGKFHVEGKVFDWVTVGKKRNDYSQGSGTSNRGGVASDALAKLEARDGKDALKEFDGVFVIYAGSRVQTNRGGVYYPHAGAVMHQGRRLPYMLSYEGGETMAPLRAYVREFAYLLGLPDLAGQPGNAGSEGVGVWCMMGGPTESRPQGLCAWSKEYLGWAKPAVIDPTVKQKLVLGPASAAPTQFLKVLVKPDGSEYFLLENRRKAGADSALPAEGLLIWRVLNNRPVLEESHGIEGAAGPRSLPELIPFPSKANNAFTPFTTPTSRSARGGGLPVYITEIRRLADGRVTFHVGYDYQ